MTGVKRLKIEQVDQKCPRWNLGLTGYLLGEGDHSPLLLQWITIAARMRAHQLLFAKHVKHINVHYTQFILYIASVTPGRHRTLITDLFFLYKQDMEHCKIYVAQRSQSNPHCEMCRAQHNWDPGSPWLPSMAFHQPPFSRDPRLYCITTEGCWEVSTVSFS